MSPRALIQRLLPAGAVTGIIGFAFMLPASPLASVFASYGYGQAVRGGGILTSGPDAGAATINEDVFVRGTDNGIWHTTWNGSAFTNWASGGGVLTSDPGATGVAAGNTKVFVRGTNDAVWQATWNGSAFANWMLLGGVATSGPDASRQPGAPGKIDLFVRGTDNGLWWRESTDDGATWPTGWISLGGILTSDPAAVSWGAGRIDVFARGSDNAVWIRSFNGTSWNAWASLGGIATSGPDAASCASGHLDVFVRGTNFGYWQLGFNGTWTGWANEGNYWTSDPGATCRPGTGIIDVYGRGSDSALYTVAEPAH